MMQCTAYISTGAIESRCPNKAPEPLRIPDCQDGRITVRMGLCKACQAAIRKWYRACAACKSAAPEQYCDECRL